MSNDVAALPHTQERVIRVSAGSSPHQLAGSVAKALAEAPVVILAAVGAGAVNQSVKALCIAQSYVAVSGKRFVVIPGMETTGDNSRPGTSGSDDITRITLKAVLCHDNQG